jgi:cation:H+ antiporter
MLLNILMLLAGLALLTKGGGMFVGAAVRLAEFLRLPRVVIGSTLVSLSTTMPELVVSIMAAARGNADLAVGNAVGSCICNIGLILGLTATIKRVDIHPRALRTALLTMIGLGVALFLLTLDLSLERWQGIALLLAGLAYFAYDLIDAARLRKPSDVAEAKAIGEVATRGLAWFATRPGTVVQFVLAAGIVVVASRMLVEAAVNLAGTLGIPPLVIGLTVVALGTSLPELVTAIGSARRDVSDLSVGNILGANIANLSLVIGVAAALTPVAMTRLTQLLDFPAMLALMGLLVWALLTQHRLTRREGVILLLSYLGYIATVVILTVTGSGRPLP